MDINACPTCGGLDETNKLTIGGKEITCNCAEQRRKAIHYSRFRIPKEYWHIGWEDFRGDAKALKKIKEEYLLHLDNAMERNIGLFLYGTVGTGKTFLAVQILKDAEAKGYNNCLFICLEDIMSNFAARWKDQAKVREFESNIMQADILVIDDLGKEFKNRLVESVFDKVIRYRETPTIVTSNITLSEISGVYGESIHSLFFSRFGHIKMVGHDYRKSLDLKEKLIKPKGYQPIK